MNRKPPAKTGLMSPKMTRRPAIRLSARKPSLKTKQSLPLPRSPQDPDPPKTSTETSSSQRLRYVTRAKSRELRRMMILRLGKRSPRKRSPRKSPKRRLLRWSRKKVSDNCGKRRLCIEEHVKKVSKKEQKRLE